MIFIVKPSLTRNIWEQVKWKCRACSSMFMTIIFVHILLGFLTSDGTGSFSTGGSLLSLQAKTYTLDGPFIYSAILLLGIGWMLASTVLTRDQQSIVTTNKTEVISTLLFLFVVSIFTFLSSLTMLFITVALETLKMSEMLVVEQFSVSFSTVALFILAMLVAGTIGYFVRTTWQFSKWLLIVLAVLLFLLIRVYSVNTWGVVFGSTTVSIIWRSIVYLFVLWGASFMMRRNREVSRS